MELAERGIVGAIRCDTTPAKGVKTYAGQVTYQAVAESLGMEYTPLEQLVQGAM